MSRLPEIKTLDKDGAIRESAERVHGDTRRLFLTKAGVGGVAAGAALGGLGAFAFAQTEDNLDDLEIFQFALTLEYLEAAFYEEAVSKGDFGGEVGTYAKTLRDHEVAHVAAIQDAITAAGGEPVPEPEFDFKNTTSDEATFLETSVVLEETGVGAYLGAAPSISNVDFLASAASILVVEALHTSWGRTLVGGGGELPAPVAFAKPLTFQEVLDAVGGTGFITSELPEAVTNAPQTADPATTG